MNARRAAALCSVGWYLMVLLFQRGGVNRHAPLKFWRLFGSYDTANDCEDEHLEMVEKGKHAAPSGHLIMRNLPSASPATIYVLRKNRR